MTIESDEMRRDYMQQLNDMRYARALPAMMEAAKKEVDRHKREGTDLFWESMSYDAWDSPQSIVDEIKKLCYHGDALPVGQLLLDKSEHYLFAHCYAEIAEEWEKYVDE